MELLKFKNYMFIITCISVLISSGCTLLYPNNKKTMVKFSDIKISGKDTGIASIINIDGYYESSREQPDILFFYPDGFIKYNSQYGVYKLMSDSFIVANIYTLGEAPDNHLTTAKFKIVNRDSIEMIWSIGREKDFDALYSTYNARFSFVKLDSIPTFSGKKLAKQKFIWDNDADMNNWLNNHFK